MIENYPAYYATTDDIFCATFTRVDVRQSLAKLLCMLPHVSLRGGIYNGARALESTGRSLKGLGPDPLEGPGPGRQKGPGSPSTEPRRALEGQGGRSKRL